MVAAGMKGTVGESDFSGVNRKPGHWLQGRKEEGMKRGWKVNAVGLEDWLNVRFGGQIGIKDESKDEIKGL